MIAQQRYNKGVAITASDTVDFANPSAPQTLCDAIYVGGAGVVPVVFQDNSVVNFTCTAGQLLPVAARRVNSTSLTATNLVALYVI